jgi:hypothetical protein
MPTALIDLNSAIACKAEATQHMLTHIEDIDMRVKMREYIGQCDAVIAGTLAYAAAFPHGAETTYLALAFGRKTTPFA